MHKRLCALTTAVIGASLVLAGPGAVQAQADKSISAAGDISKLLNSDMLSPKLSSNTSTDDHFFEFCPETNDIGMKYPLALSFSTFERAQEIQNILTRNLGPGEGKYKIYSVRFFSNQGPGKPTEGDPTAFLPDTRPDWTGWVNMESYNYQPRWWREGTQEGPYVAASCALYNPQGQYPFWQYDFRGKFGWGTLRDFSRPLLDFDRQVFTVVLFSR